MRLLQFAATVLLTLFTLSGVSGETLPFRTELLKADSFTRIGQDEITVSIPCEKESRDETRGGTWVITPELLERLKGRSLSFRCEVLWKDIAPKAPSSPCRARWTSSDSVGMAFTVLSRYRGRVIRPAGPAGCPL